MDECGLRCLSRVDMILSSDVQWMGWPQSDCPSRKRSAGGLLAQTLSSNRRLRLGGWWLRRFWAAESCVEPDPRRGDGDRSNAGSHSTGQPIYRGRVETLCRTSSSKQGMGGSRVKEEADGAEKGRMGRGLDWAGAGSRRRGAQASGTSSKRLATTTGRALPSGGSLSTVPLRWVYLRVREPRRCCRVGRETALLSSAKTGTAGVLNSVSLRCRGSAERSEIDDAEEERAASVRQRVCQNKVAQHKLKVISCQRLQCQPVIGSGVVRGPRTTELEIQLLHDRFCV